MRRAMNVKGLGIEKSVNDKKSHSVSSQTFNFKFLTNFSECLKLTLMQNPSQFSQRFTVLSRHLNSQKEVKMPIDENPLTTHVLDTARGVPAADLKITLSKREGNVWKIVSQRETNADGRAKEKLITHHEFVPGVYRMHFATEAYFQTHGIETFYPYVEIVFQIIKTGDHYHVPLILSPYGYTTYRGS